MILIMAVLVNICLISMSYGATIKGYDKDNFSRIVITSNAPASYTLKRKDENTYILSMAGDDIIWSQNDLNVSRLSSITQTSKNSINLTLVPDGQIRHFKTGSKIIIDINGINTTPATQETPLKTSVPTNNDISTAIHVVTPKKIDTSNITTDNVIEITATETVSLTAFTRNQYLWIIVDKPDFLIPPTIKGPQKSVFSGFKRIKIPQATAFKMSLPETHDPLFIYAEGGGLVWRIILTPDKQKAKPLKTLVTKNNQLHWPDQHAQRIIKLNDPDHNDTIILATTQKVGSTQLQEKSYVDVSTLPSYIGVAIIPKTDDIQSQITSEGVTLTGRNRPLHVTNNISDNKEADIPTSPNNSEILTLANDNNRIFQFEKWQLGGSELYTYNERLLISNASGKDTDNRLNTLVKLARFEASHCRAAEAIGFLELIKNTYPAVIQSPEFLALEAASHALAGQHDIAHTILRSDKLQSYDELNLWRSFSLAGLEDWNQAGETLPEELGMIELYPTCLQNILGLTLSEIALRQGRQNDASIILSLISQNIDTLPPSQLATHDYLLGESNRQQGDIEQAKEIWGILLTSKDDLYRTKAGLALTRLLYDGKDISSEDAINRLERLRYAWRGDDLETQINYHLGLAYLDHKDYIRGLNILRTAASRSPDPELAREIAKKMSQEFQNVFTKDGLKTLDPLEAITLYEEFSELAPSGEKGRVLTQQLIERLIEIDLLGRASSLLKNQIQSSNDVLEQIPLSIRLASVQLANSLPQDALQTLQQVGSNLATIKERSDNILNFQQDIGLLKAHAYTKLDQPDNALVALSRLNQDNIVTKMRADIAWRAGQWQTASEALEELINRSNINLNNQLSNEHADLILNWAITLNLSDNRYILNSLKDRFGDAMNKTPRAQQFEVITRPEQQIFLSDRKTIENMIAEVDIFDGFLDQYNAGK